MPKKTPVIVYQDPNYGGESKQLVEGVNSAPSNFDNDVISSVKVPAGWKVTLYETIYNTGKELALTQDTSDLRKLHFDNITSSILVEAIPNEAISKVAVGDLMGSQPNLLFQMAGAEKKRLTLEGNSLNPLYLAGGFHAQAVGQYGDYMYVAFSELVGHATLWIYNLTTKVSSSFDLPSGYPHPCSIQIVGAHLIIAIEAAYGTLQSADLVKRDKKSAIVIYSLLYDPANPTEVTRITQNDTNCGGAGLTYHPPSKRWYILGDQDDLGQMVIYRSKGDSLEEWETTPIKSYKRYGSGAGLNLITASDNSVWGLYYEDTTGGIPDFTAWDMTADVVRLFKILSPDGKPVQQIDAFKQITNVGSPKIKGIGEMLANRPSMRFGASLRNENGKLELLVCQRNMDSAFHVDRAILNNNQASILFVNFGDIAAEMYASSNGQTKHSGHLSISESWGATLARNIHYNINYFFIAKWADLYDGTTSAPLSLFTVVSSGTRTKVKPNIFTTSKALLDRDRLEMGEYLLPGNRLISKNEKHSLHLTNHGTLELIREEDKHLVWGEDFGRNDCYCTIDAIHGFCIQAGNPNAPGDIIWSTKMPTPQAFVIMQDDGNLCQYKGTPFSNGGYMWGSKQDKGTIPASLKIKISGVRFTCTFSDDEGANNKADMDRLYLYANVGNQPEQTVVGWSTSGEWTVSPNDYKDFPNTLDLVMNGVSTGQLHLRAWTREYDTTSKDEHGHAKKHFTGNELWELAFLHKNGFPHRQFSFDVNSADAGFRVSFTLEVTY